VWPGCMPPSASDILELEEQQLEVMTYEELHDLALHLGLLVSDDPSMPVLKARIMRAAL
jgi:hypothetical protein